MPSLGAVELLAVILAGAVTVLIIDRLLRQPLFVMGGVLLAEVVLPTLGFLALSLVAGEAAEEATGPIGIQLWLLRLGTLVLVVTVGLGLLKVVALRVRSPRPGAVLLVGAVAFFGAMLLSELYAGVPRQFTLLAVPVVVALWAAPTPSPERLADLLKWTAFTIIGLSLLGALFALPRVWAEYPQSLIPGLPLRLRGFALHPNSLGPVIVLYLILERYRPSVWRGRPVLLMLALVALTLTQSKTAWGAALVVYAIHWAWGASGKRQPVALAAVAVAVLIAVGFAVFGPGLTEDVLEAEPFSGARTLTGRTGLWEQGLDFFSQDPWVGAGPRVFEQWATLNDQGWAGQAHNQLVQTLGTSGLLGAAGLLVYICALIVVAARCMGRSRGTSLSILAALLLRCVTETPLDEFEFLHIAAFVLLLSWERAGGVVEPTRTGTHPADTSRGRIPLSA